MAKEDTSGVVAKVDSMVGKQAHVRLGGMLVKVKVLDYKKSYGKDRWLVEPVAGQGKVWVQELTLTK